MIKIKGFEDEYIVVSDFGEWVGNNYIDYKSEYKNNQKIIKDLLKENEQQKEVIDKIKKLIKSKDNGICFHNNKERNAYTFVLNFDEARQFIWDLEDILKGCDVIGNRS